MFSSIMIGDLNIESVELNSCESNLHIHVQLDSSFIAEKDFYVFPIGGLIEDRK